MKKFTVEIKSYLWLNSDQMNDLIDKLYNWGI